jgi:hypothetical protein
MPGVPHERDRAFFGARNLLERKHLGDFLSELRQLEVGAGRRARCGSPGTTAPAAARQLTAVCCIVCCAVLQGPLAGPAKPPELIKFNTAQTVGEAMKVRSNEVVPPNYGPHLALHSCGRIPPPIRRLAQPT